MVNSEQKPTISLDDFRQLLAEEEKGNRKQLSEGQRLEYAVAALNTMRGLELTEKRMVVRRMAKLLNR